MTKIPTSAESALAEGIERFPRIAHVGLWVLWTFFLYGCYEVFLFDGTVPLSDDQARIARIFSAIDGIAYGLAVTGAIVLFVRTYQGASGLLGSEPGHWIALRITAMIGIEVVAGLLWRALSWKGLEESFRSTVTGVWAYSANLLFVSFLLVYPIWKFRHLRAWQMFFALETCFFMFSIVWSAFGYPEKSTEFLVTSIPDFFSLVLIIALLAACSLDLAASRARGWIHYAGVAAYMVNACRRVVWNLYLSGLEPFLPMGA